MAIEVMLMQDVKELGALGAVVTVKDGYARNYLLPRKLAQCAQVRHRRERAPQIRATLAMPAAMPATRKVRAP